MSLYSIDQLLQLTRLANTNKMGADLVMALENSGTPVTGDHSRSYPDGKPRLDILGLNWGLASATMGSLQFGVSAAASALVARLANGTPMPMTGMMLLGAALAFVMLLFGRRAPA